MTLRYLWTQTWSWAPDDGCVRSERLDHPTDVLRVMLIVGGPNDGKWAWSASRLMPPGENGLRGGRNWSGYVDTKEEAQEAAEAAYSRGADT